MQRLVTGPQPHAARAGAPVVDHGMLDPHRAAGRALVHLVRLRTQCTSARRASPSRLSEAGLHREIDVVATTSSGIGLPRPPPVGWDVNATGVLDSSKPSPGHLNFGDSIATYQRVTRLLLSRILRP
jgi:hypothetical protein